MQGDPVKPGMAGRERGMGNENVATSCANFHVLPIKGEVFCLNIINLVQLVHCVCC